jgi:hypothetical protein
LFNQIEFWVGIWRKKGREPMFFAVRFKCRFNGSEIGLVEKELTATAVNTIIRTLEVLALHIEACCHE